MRLKQAGISLVLQNSEPMSITISGQAHTVDAAANAVQEIIAGGNPFGANAPPNFAGGVNRAVLIPGCCVMLLLCTSVESAQQRNVFSHGVVCHALLLIAWC